MIIAFLGTGLMGFPMAENLLNAGFKLHVYNRSYDKTAALQKLGATRFRCPQQAVKNADIIITMLADEKIQEQVLFNPSALTACKSNSLIIDMGSIAPDTAIEHAKQASKYQLCYLDAPVSGGTLGAENAELVIMVGGSNRDLHRAQAVFQALGNNTVHIGATGTGQIAKCANQAIVAITIGAVSEALLLAQQGGANISAVRKALLGGFAASKVLEQHGQRMLDRNFTAGATASVQLKDLTNITELASRNNLHLPLTASIFSQYQVLVNSGKKNLDHSALLLQS
ncbi:MAG: NAD binding domain of 6-phosphogluconate dehydrogenase family [Osedax symbiont Rs1]|nr:MAG: NAD binding domain of 6-phosphogluconate dehydrogenase family [Osedax symbiont Rs1]